MEKFTYTATNSEGVEYKRSIEANDRFEIYDVVRKEGGTIVSIKKASQFSFKNILEQADAFLGNVKQAEKIIFARNLSTMIKAGLSLSRSLDVAIRQTKNKKLKSILSSISRDVGAGEPLNSALGKFPKVFSPLFVSMVRAGEESGKISEALLVIANQMDQSYKLKKKVRGALIYPSIVVIAMIAIGILMLIYVVPTLSQTFAELDADLPTATRVIIAGSDFLVNNIILSLILMFSVALGFVIGLRTKKGKRMFEFSILHLPVIGDLVKEVNAARTTRTLSSLLSAGVEVTSSLSITQDVMQNSYYKEVLSRAETDVQKGDSMSSVFVERSDLYPVMVGDMMAVGEETGQLSAMLEEIATFFEEDVSQRTKDLSTVIEPFLMIIIGIGVGFFAISMITPIYSISNSI